MRTRRDRAARGRAEVSAGTQTALVDAIAAATARRGYYTVDITELPPVVAARSLIADTVAQIPFVATKGNRAAERQPTLLRRPDPAEPRWLTISRTVNDLTGTGRAWWLVTARDAANWANALMVLPDREVTYTLDGYGRPEYIWWQGRRYRVGAEVIHIPNMVDRDHVGRSPLSSSRAVFDGIAALYETEAQFWAESGVPPFAIRSRYALDSEQTVELQAQWSNARARSGLPAILTGELELQELAGTAPTLFENARESAIAETARAFRIPPSLLNARAGDSLTYSNTESQFRAWLTTGLVAYINRIEAAFSDLLPYGTDVRGDTAELLRTDTAARFTAYATATGNAPWLTVDEVRAMEGRPPLDQSGASPLDLANPTTPPNLTGV
jgi:HK97 family phage portal protein